MEIYCKKKNSLTDFRKSGCVLCSKNYSKSKTTLKWNFPTAFRVRTVLSASGKNLNHINRLGICSESNINLILYDPLTFQHISALSHAHSVCCSLAKLFVNFMLKGTRPEYAKCNIINHAIYCVVRTNIVDICDDMLIVDHPTIQMISWLFFFSPFRIVSRTNFFSTRAFLM